MEFRNLSQDCLLLALMLLIGQGWVFAQAQPAYRASYTLTFEADWSAMSHPDQFPSNPHFSPLIGTSHNGDGVLWRNGELASAGIEAMAELGSTSTLRQEITALMDAGVAETLISGSGIGTSPGMAEVSFDVSQAYPLVSITSMLAPSPDWFIGVDALNLRENGEWLEDQIVTLWVFDSGTDSGANYQSSNADTQPAEPIFLIEEGPVANGVPVGQFRFQLQSVQDHFPLVGSQSGVYFDPERDGEGLYLVIGTVGDRTLASATWFTYSQGQQLWLAGNTDLEPGSDQVSIELFATSGADFGQAFDPLDVAVNSWGVIDIRVPTCGMLNLSYSDHAQVQSGDLILQQLVPVGTDACQ
jgi:hypothetical protein